MVLYEGETLGEREWCECSGVDSSLGLGEVDAENGVGRSCLPLLQQTSVLAFTASS